LANSDISGASGNARVVGLQVHLNRMHFGAAQFALDLFGHIRFSLNTDLQNLQQHCCDRLNNKDARQDTQVSCD
jgi:hypothetical protein